MAIRLTDNSSVANVAVNPADELGHSGVHAGEVGSAAARPPAHDADQKPASTLRTPA